MTHDLVSFVEDSIFEITMAHNRDCELRKMDSIQDVLKSLPSDAEEDLKEELWRRILREIDGREVLSRIRNLLAESSDEEEDAKSESSCE
jgi:histone acetyltransferase (RNA polymerase elongator complex component)